ncbi:MAG TPA: class I SAM-dependent RNA methyltransferase [Clostridiaceae bacterium]|jgi:putative N6-adenine-specific DNA methylase|nr:class I SAM-dependent RNA methyltransferase [Clostridiaceae bacterium]
MEIIITALFGLESLVRQDLEHIGYDKSDIQVQDGQVILSVPKNKVAQAVARVNLWVRHGERVLLSLGTFRATTFDDFFEGIEKMPWEEWIPESFAFHVNGYSRKSQLFGIPACQSLCKKAIVKRLIEKGRGKGSQYISENPEIGLLNVRFGIVSDNVRMMMDTSGDGLHKRGYRPLRHIAPIKETLASGLVMLSKYQPFGYEAVVDPCCGSGTIVIESALAGLNIAPGLNRPFDAQRWPFVGARVFAEAREEAKDMVIKPTKDGAFYFGSDIDGRAVSNAIQNARAAGVESVTRFKTEDLRKQDPEALAAWTGLDRQLVVCNPPYGGRMMTEEEAVELFGSIGHTYLDRDGFCKKGIRLTVISPDDSFEKAVGRNADKRIKLYNGNIRCQMNHYFRMIKTM